MNHWGRDLLVIFGIALMVAGVSGIQTKEYLFGWIDLIFGIIITGVNIYRGQFDKQ